MRMEKIFKDFEAQLAAERTRTIEYEAQDTRRAEFPKITQADRFAAQLGKTLQVNCAEALTWEGELVSMGNGWIQLRAHAENVLIPMGSINWWEGGHRGSFVESSTVARRLSMGYALRALATARLPLRIFHDDGSVTSEGTIERVGMDFLELALHPLEGSYRLMNITGYRTLGLSRVSAVCSLAL